MTQIRKIDTPNPNDVNVRSKKHIYKEVHVYVIVHEVCKVIKI